MGLPVRIPIAVSVVAVCASALVGTAPAGAATVALNPRGSLVVTYRGDGHGHGMSQYGAYGAALAGRTAAEILAFYYPGTTLATVPRTAVRVLLGGAGPYTTVLAQSKLRVSGVSGYLPTAGVRAYRLVADASSTIALQHLPSARGARWSTMRYLPDGSTFSRSGNATTRVLLADGTSTDYYGVIRSVRVSPVGYSGVTTINYVDDNDYAAGVAPREMPASWSATATSAQAVAARSYALYERENARGASYDLCDSSWCQVYGGHAHYAADGSVLWTDLPSAANSTTNEVLTYRGALIFAQYSASDGGWSTAGGEPYLRAVADPYDPGRSGDPYVDATTTVPVSDLAQAAGLSTATRFAVATRDGHGQWGGRVISATVWGTKGGQPATATLSGEDLASAFGIDTTWVTVTAAS